MDLPGLDTVRTAGTQLTDFQITAVLSKQIHCSDKQFDLKKVTILNIYLNNNISKMDKLSIFGGRQLSNISHSAGDSKSYRYYNCLLQQYLTLQARILPPSDHKYKLHIQPFVKPKTVKQVCFHLLPCYKRSRQHTNVWTIH